MRPAAMLARSADHAPGGTFAANGRHAGSRDWQRLLLCAALIQFSGAGIAILLVDSIVVIVANYTPVLLFFLILNQRDRRDGKGSRGSLQRAC